MVTVTTGIRPYKTYKAPVKLSSPTTQHPAFYRFGAVRDAQPIVEAEKEKYHISRTVPPSSPGVFHPYL